jgi:hypothetical protein
MRNAAVMRGQKRVLKGVHARLRRAMDARERAFDPRIHLLRKDDGLHRNSGLPEFRIIKRRKSGKPDLRCQARQ